METIHSAPDACGSIRMACLHLLEREDEVEKSMISSSGLAVSRPHWRGVSQPPKQHPTTVGPEQARLLRSSNLSAGGLGAELAELLTVVLSELAEVVEPPGVGGMTHRAGFVA
jgi:hypothetical protein